MAEYAIVIKNETGGASQSPLAKTGQGGEAQQTVGGEPSNAVKNIYGGLLAYNHYIKPFVSQVVNSAVNTVSLRTGAQELQQRISFAKDIGESVIGLGTSLLAGFAVGGVAGAAVGAVLSIATTALSYANRQYTINTENNLEKISLGMLNLRAGSFPPGYTGSRYEGR